MAQRRQIPRSRLGRLSMIGRLAGGIAGSVISEGAKQLTRGQRPVLSELLLTPGNAQKIADKLSEMRGAAMKVGQLLSMDSGHLLPPELSEALDRLRENAHQMPLGEVARILGNAWGKGWETHFNRFLFNPIAAASIGQVHEAVTKDDRHLAIKIQYPGIRDSIDSDVDNVAAFLRMLNLVPQGLDIGPVLEDAKQQLHAEADYRQEARAMERVAQLVAADGRFVVPQTIQALSSENVLAMSYLDGEPIEKLVNASQSVRNSVATTLLDLALTEVFDWGLVQTDPNFANYLYQPATGCIQLLDFGATRVYSSACQANLRKLLGACSNDNEPAIASAATDAGYLGKNDPTAYRNIIIQLLKTVTEPARAKGTYSFTDTTLAQRMQDIVIDMRLRHKFTRLPPSEILFLHRKLGGLYLLFTRLRATVPVRELIERHLTSQPSMGDEQAA